MSGTEQATGEMASAAVTAVFTPQSRVCFPAKSKHKQ